MATLTLDDIQQRIARRDSELQALRRELEDRQSQLTSLTRRREELQDQLQQIEAEMAAIAAGKRPKAVPPKASMQEPPPGPTAGHMPGQPSLADLIVAMIREAGRPLTVKQMTDEARRRGFQSSSANFAKVVESRTHALKNRGVLRRSAAQPGYVLVDSSDGRAQRRKPGRPPGSGAAKATATPAADGQRTKRIPLRVVLMQILEKSSRPLTGSELAAAALRAGWRTKSERPTDVVWAMLNQMDNIENVKGEGYRLRKGRWR
jgi:hypothetical protein